MLQSLQCVQYRAEWMKYKDHNYYFGIDDPNECWEILYKRIIEILDKMCPEKTFTVNSYREEWMNKDIMHGKDN